MARKEVVEAMILVKKIFERSANQPRKGSHGEAEAVEQFVGVYICYYICYSLI